MYQMILRNIHWQLFVPTAHGDAAEAWQLGFQDAATPMMQGIIDLHHDIFVLLSIILIFVLWMLVRALWHFHYQRNPIPFRMVHGTTMEIIWTIFPSLILMLIAIPSFALLYSMDEIVDPAITIKAIGHQWYWSAPLNESDGSATKKYRIASMVRKASGLPNKGRESRWILARRRETRGTIACQERGVEVEPIHWKRLPQLISLWFHSRSRWRYAFLLSVWAIHDNGSQPAMSDSSAEVVDLSAPQPVAETSDLTGLNPSPLGMGDPPIGNNHGFTKPSEELRGRRFTVPALPFSGTEVPW